MTQTLIELLLEDHDEAERLLTLFDQVADAQCQRAFRRLTQTLVQHEVAEDEVVYPVVRRCVDGGDELAGDRIEEQSAVEEHLCTMERQLEDHTAFMRSFVDLRDAVLAHADAEERSVFPELAAAVEPDELVALGRRYERARASAPTHVRAPDERPGNLVRGPVAALVDRARDAVR